MYNSWRGNTYFGNCCDLTLPEQDRQRKSTAKSKSSEWPPNRSLWWFRRKISDEDGWSNWHLGWKFMLMLTLWTNENDFLFGKRFKCPWSLVHGHYIGWSLSRFSTTACASACWLTSKLVFRECFLILLSTQKHINTNIPKVKSNIQ